MASDRNSNDITLGIVGTGLMGRGIAQISVLAGVRVLLFDAQPQAAAEARDFVEGMLQRLVEKGKLEQSGARQAMERFQIVPSLEGLAPCQLVIEAIVEQLAAKRALFQALEKVVAEDCLLATNTSSLSVTAIAAGCQNPGRVGGFHFFSPVPLMKIVEVIDGLLTEEWVGTTLVDLARRMGHTPVRAKDTPGFIVNHAGRGFGTEALRLLSEGVTEFYEIDRVLREAAGFRMGPFELMDLTGLDVSHPVIESIYNQYYQEARFRPTPLTGLRMTAGLLGRKSGRGFYRYQGQMAETMPVAEVPEARPASVWVSRADALAYEQVSRLLSDLGAVIDSHEKPRAESLCIVTPLGCDATTAALAEQLDARRTLAIDTLFDLHKRRTLMSTPVTSPAMREAAHGLFASDGVPVTMIRDSAGFIAQRVVALIVNISCDIAQQGIATPEDIDRAVTLGLGYPSGPLAWGDQLGAARILTILEEMFDFYGDPRYRPSPWLTRRARLAVSLLTTDAY